MTFCCDLMRETVRVHGKSINPISHIQCLFFCCGRVLLHKTDWEAKEGERDEVMICLGRALC